MGDIVLAGATSGACTLHPTDISGSTVLTLPTTSATLITDSSGILNIGSGQVYKDASGNVGIGTSSPFGKLVVSNTGAQGIEFGYSVALTANFMQSINRPSGVDVDMAYYLAGAGVHRFYTNATERMRIDSSGNLLVGTTASGSPSSGFVFSPSVGGSYLNIGHANGTPSGQQYQLFYYNSTLIGNIAQNGTTGVLYNLTSDYRLKNNPTALTGASEFIKALQPKTWDWWDGSGKGVGFIAHEFMEVAKHSGNGTKDEVDAEGKPVMQAIQPSSSEVMANLVSFVQEQQTLIEALTARLTKAGI